MAAEVRFTESQAKTNAEEAKKWKEKYNSENRDTVASLDLLANGNVKFTISKKDAANVSQVAPHP